MIKRILVGLGTSRHAESVVSHAIEIAQSQQAELLGVAVVDPSRLEWTGPRPIGVGVETLTAELRQDRMEKVAAEIEKANKLFAEKCMAAGVPHQTSEQTGNPFEIVADLVRYQDLCVFGLQGLFEHDVVPEPTDSLERLVAAGVRPMLAVSEMFRPVRRVLVAYSGSLESAKTFKHFVQSGIYPEAKVRVVHFCNDLNAGSRRLKAAEGYFASHGRDVETDLIQGDPVQEVVSYAETWEADLIVAGNSAKNLLLRKLFGETALQLLRGSPLPLFLAQ
ncbi:MAG: universal stress protein [Planctomycetaceae bacterium]|jgi:nucleotide-binding universal stress UspA family protein|nr:universal stress protein [Planctomycetaceae bacterium]MBT6056133.1 universal stress protein [Planctomycetaceae bacterium]MBT6459946.1 universal stress protein [Planctomycetaceae bacterium]MBT7728401.1 universal stress protein [Planctomycetaceae bacterium]